MNAQVASFRDGLSFRQIIAFDLFHWNLRLGFAVAPREKSEEQLRRRRRMRWSAVPAHLRDDIGLPREEDHSLQVYAYQRLLMR